MYERILVPLKLDPSDEAVIEHVGSLAQLTGGRVTLAHVVHSHSRDESTYVEGKARLYLNEQAKLMTAHGIRADVRTVVAEPDEGITAIAQEIGADLIVMATHGHREMRHVLVGSVTEDVVRRSDIPVLLVRPKPE